jgi:protein O-mannosyl-transferase
VLSGFFWLLSLLAYVAYVQRRQGERAGAWRYYAAAFLCFAGGLMSKPMVVTLPLVLLVLDVWPLRRLEKERWLRLALEKVPFVLLSLVVSRITIVAQRNIGTLSEVLPLESRLANALVAVPRYLAKLVWPADLAVLYPHPGFWPGLVVLAAVLFVLGVTAFAWWQRQRRPWLLGGWFWFCIVLLPVSGVVQVGIQSMADRYTYLPMIGVQLALGWTMREMIGGHTRMPARIAVAVVALLVAVASRTWHQLGVWRNSLTLFHHTIAVAGEDNYLAYDNRGVALSEAGKVEAALSDFRQALAIAPTYPNANNNLARLIAQRGQLAEAIALYRTALRSKPDMLEVHNNLGNALSDAGQIDEAMVHYRVVLERKPNHINARNGYAVALASKGQLNEARAELETVLRLAPDDVSAHTNMGNVCAMLGQHDEAIRHFQASLARSPDDPRTLYNLGNVFTERGQLPAAVETFQRVVQLAPVNPDAHAALGTALARLGRFDEARRHLQIALQQRPDFPQAKAWLGKLPAAAPRK